MIHRVPLPGGEVAVEETKAEPMVPIAAAAPRKRRSLVIALCFIGAVASLQCSPAGARTVTPRRPELVARAVAAPGSASRDILSQIRPRLTRLGTASLSSWSLPSLALVLASLVAFAVSTLLGYRIESASPARAPPAHLLLV